jgi:hypothetical protein
LAPFADLGKRLVAKVVDEKLSSYVLDHGPTGYAVINALTEFARDMEDREKAELVELAAGKIAAMSHKAWSPYLA